VYSQKPPLGRFINYAAFPAVKNLVVYWPMNEGTGGRLRDHSANGYNAIVTNSDYVWSKKFGPMIDFGSTTQTYFSFTDITSLGYTNPCTFIWRSRGGQHGLFGSNLGADTSDYVTMNEGVSLVWRSGAVTKTYGNVISFTDWHTFALTSDGGGIGGANTQCFVDGLLKQTISSTTGGFGHFDRINGAYGVTVCPFDVAWLMAFNRVLNRSEINLLYHEPFIMFKRRRRVVFPTPAVGVTMAGYYYKHFLGGAA